MSNMVLQMAACWYPVTVFGPGKKLGIWFQGCNKKCEECISPEFQTYEGGQKIENTCLLEGYHMEKPDGLVVSGGEPFDQPEALLDLVKEFETRYGDDIIIYTGYRLAELQQKPNDVYREILRRTAVLIDGRYEPARNTGVGLAGSSNQKIHILKKHEIYEGADKWKRKIMCILKKNGDIWMVGVPPSE